MASIELFEYKSWTLGTCKPRSVYDVASDGQAALLTLFRQVRAMNKAMKQERFRTKEQESYGGLSGSDGLSPDSRQGSEDVWTFACTQHQKGSFLLINYFQSL